ncbi:hypothetical protein [Methanoculleus sp.]|uniref:hypothetical protein n=1 Tax=Methanoculleus sp. TaxID=90427 RepID=UPI002FCC8084
MMASFSAGSGTSNEGCSHHVRHLEPAATFRERYLYSNVGYFVAGGGANREVVVSSPGRSDHP